MNTVFIILLFAFVFLENKAFQINRKRSKSAIQHEHYTLHPLHSVGNHQNQPSVVNAVIQISEGENAKYELDEATGLLKLDRILATPVFFPLNYGFLPKSLGEDNDPLDVMVISSIKIKSLTIVAVRVLGVMRMTDTGETDDKLIGVPDKDPIYADYKQLSDIPVSIINRVKTFFETYKILDKKTVTVNQFDDRLKAFETIIDCKRRYQQSFQL